MRLGRAASRETSSCDRQADGRTLRSAGGKASHSRVKRILWGLARALQLSWNLSGGGSLEIQRAVTLLVDSKGPLSPNSRLVTELIPVFADGQRLPWCNV